MYKISILCLKAYFVLFFIHFILRENRSQSIASLKLLFSKKCIRFCESPPLDVENKDTKKERKSIRSI